jgi:hypothetical protein
MKKDYHTKSALHTSSVQPYASMRKDSSLEPDKKSNSKFNVSFYDNLDMDLKVVDSEKDDLEEKDIIHDISFQ